MQTTRPAPRSSASPGGWAAIGLAQTLWQRFAEAARAMPRRAWARYARALAIGLAVTCLVSLGVTLWAQRAAPQWLDAWDRAALEAVVAAEPLSIPRAIIFESPGNMVGIALLMAAVLPLAMRAGRPVIVSNMLLGYAIGAAAFWVGWGLWSRERPDLVLDGVAAPGLHSFPSGHMVHVTLLYGYLAYLWCRASRSPLERALAVLLCAAWITLVALSRLVLGTHWPSDVIAGTLLGLLVAASLAVAQRQAERS
jgi:membrane-associated phospholipid phosphatase